MSVWSVYFFLGFIFYQISMIPFRPNGSATQDKTALWFWVVVAIISVIVMIIGLAGMLFA